MKMELEINKLYKDKHLGLLKYLGKDKKGKNIFEVLYIRFYTEVWLTKNDISELKPHF
jgi:hypothetical protein